MNFPIYITFLKNMLIIIKRIPQMVEEIIIKILSITVQVLSDLLQLSFKMISKYSKIPLVSMS
jgi:hypothetical protein